MMNKETDEELREKIAEQMKDSNYFGPFGAVTIFQLNYLPFAEIKAKDGDFELLLWYVSILYSTLGKLYRGGWLQKLKAVVILIALNYWVRKMQKLGLEYKKLPSGENHTLLSVYSAMLQAFKKVELHKFDFLVRKTQKEFHEILEALRLKAKVERYTQGLFQGVYGDQGVSCLMGEGLLFQLHQAGLVLDLPQDAGIPDEIERYAEHQIHLREAGVIDGDMQIVIRLLRYIGRDARADEIARLYGTKDQQIKSMV